MCEVTSDQAEKIRAVYEDLGRKISETLLTYEDMVAGTKKAHEEARERMEKKIAVPTSCGRNKKNASIRMD